jgi:DNA-binding response OmpR family regulator
MANVSRESVAQFPLESMVALLAEPERCGVEQLASRLGLSLAVFGDAGPFLDELQRRRPDVAVIDLDASGATDDAFRLTRNLAQPPIILAIACYWCDRTPLVRQLSDGVLYRPARPGVWEATVSGALRGRGAAATLSLAPAR